MQIIYLTAIDKAQAAGLPWRSVHAARWDYRHRFDAAERRNPGDPPIRRAIRTTS
jgi:hypothetical protein